MATLATLVAANAQKTLSSATGSIYVNSYYDGVNFTGPIGTTQVLSTKYATLAAAQVDYPLAQALTDEVDWVCWMEAFLQAYDHNPQHALGYAGGRIVASGLYVVNQSLVCNLTTPIIVGTSSNYGNPVGTSTTITYNGVNGTVDAPIYILDLWTVGWNVGAQTWNLQATQLGSSTQSTNATGPSPYIQFLTFAGKNGNMLGLVGNESGYISGIRVRNAAACVILDCTFGHCLWDGIFTCGPTTTTLYQRCNFYGVYRDCISFAEVEGGGVSAFSTTMWVRENTFGWYNRYGICLNGFNTIGATPIISNNVWEPQGGSFFLTNPSWFIHGVPALATIFGVSALHFSDSYLEVNITGLGIIHLGDCLLGQLEILGGSGDNSSVVCSASRTPATGSSTTISGTTMTIAGTVSGVFFVGQGIIGDPGIPKGTYITALPGGGGGVAGTYTISASLTISAPFTVSGITRTAAALAYAAANGYCDVTNLRNYICGQADTANYSGGIEDFRFAGIGNLHTVGGIRFGGQIQIDKSTVNCIDFSVVNELAGVSACQSGTVSANILTVDATATGAPFSPGQTVWGPGKLGQGPLRSVYTILSQNSGTTGSIGAYTLSTSIVGSALAQPIYACALTQKKIDDFGVFSGAANSLVEATSLVNPTTLANPDQIQSVYLKAYSTFEARQSIDNAHEIGLFSELFFRDGNNLNVDGSSAATWNGYLGLTLNRFVNNITTDNTDLPFIFGNITNSSASAVRYIETAVMTSRKIRYNFSSAPASGTWNKGDLAYNTNVTSGGFVGWVCVAAGSPGTWKTFGLIS